MPLPSDTSLAHLHDLLAQGHALTQEEACTRLGLASTRQVRRLVKQLRERDVPVEERRRAAEDARYAPKEYFLATGDQHVPGAPVPLTERQMLALVVASEAARTALRPTPLAAPLDEAIALLVDYLAPGAALSFEHEEEPARWDFGHAPSVDLDPAVFDVLKKAVSERQSVRIDYLTASSGRYWEGRKIDPLMMAVRGGAWLVAAYCHERRRVKDFSLAGIDAAVLCNPEEDPGAYFAAPADFDPEAHFAGRFSALDGGAVQTVRLLVEKDRAPYFRRKAYHPSQHIEEVRADGRLVVTYEVAGLDEIAAFVRSWGPGVTVIDPAALRTRISSEAAQVTRRYEAGGDL